VIFDCNGSLIQGFDGTGDGIRLGWGTYPDGADSNTVKNCTLDNWENGINIIEDSDYNNITNITVTGNDYGLNLFDSNFNNITDIITDNNNMYGFFIDNSESNTLIRITAVDNVYGFYLDTSGNTLIRDSKITGTGAWGIVMDEAGQGNANRIYNNFFNNSNNIRFSGTIFDNEWNLASPGLGPNIVGGPDIGGNYWGRPDGSGFSDTCTPDGVTGFCQNDLNLTNMMPCSGSSCSGNTDWMPLTDSCAPDCLFEYGICWCMATVAGENCDDTCDTWGGGLSCYDPDWSLYEEDCSLHEEFGLSCSPCSYRPDPVDPSQNTVSGECYYTNSSSPPRDFSCGSSGVNLKRICPCQ
jgi:parallel beta-helix repeat protein